MARDRYRVVIEGAAKGAYLAMAGELKAAVYSALECLETDPYINVGGVHWKKSYAFRDLKKLGVDVQIFKAFEIQDWRTFFYVDEVAGTVVVKEIVSRETDALTYGLDRPHVRRLVENYRRWVQRRVQ